MNYGPKVTYQKISHEMLDKGVEQTFIPPVYVVRNQNYLSRLSNSFLIPTRDGHTLVLLWVIDELVAELL